MKYVLVFTHGVVLSIGFIIGAYHSDHTFANITVELVTLLITLFE